ncbi:hypothetical protein [Modestobacter sp. I12A-02662]|uniref:hypothetical protein n=1 Tax=Modestobacter sp. I12A-02662 TaxID=1730496 RepID=UPI0034DDF072
MSNKRALAVGFLTAGLSAGILATAITPAAAQGAPVGGSGNGYYLAGAGNTNGMAAYAFAYGEANDEVYFGNFVDATPGDEALVRRGNGFILRGSEGTMILFGDKGDTVLVGNFDADPEDEVAVRRGNHYFVKNALDKSGYSDSDFWYGDPNDQVLVGDWDGDANNLDTLMVRRGNHYFVSNVNANVYSEYDFHYGEVNDTVLAGDWAKAPAYVKDNPATPDVDESKQYAAAADDPATRNVDESKVTFGLGLKVKDLGVNSNGVDQLAIKRGNQYFLSEEISVAKVVAPAVKLDPISTTSFYYGNPGDTAFVANFPYTYDDNRAATTGAGTSATITGDGIGIRRVIG